MITEKIMQIAQTNIVERTTNVAAAGAITGPFWGDWAMYISPVLTGVVLPAMGSIWFGVQIWAKLKSMRQVPDR